MVIFHSYVSLPEGNPPKPPSTSPHSKHRSPPAVAAPRRAPALWTPPRPRVPRRRRRCGRRRPWRRSWRKRGWAAFGWEKTCRKRVETDGFFFCWPVYIYVYVFIYMLDSTALLLLCLLRPRSCPWYMYLYIYIHIGMLRFVGWKDMGFDGWTMGF